MSETVTSFAAKVKTIGGAALVTAAVIAGIWTLVMQVTLAPILTRFDRMTLADSMQVAALRQVTGEVARISRSNDLVIEALLYPQGSRERLKAIRRLRPNPQGAPP